MELQGIRGQNRNANKNTFGPRTRCHHQNEAQNKKRSRWFVMITACLGLICVLLLVAIIVQHNKISTDRELMMKSYIIITEKYDKTLSSLKVNYSHLTDERDQLQNSLSAMSQKKLELETKCNQLTDEKNQLQKNLNSVGQKKLELETKFSHLTDEKNQLQNGVNSVCQRKLELGSSHSQPTKGSDQLQNSLNSMCQKKMELETRAKQSNIAGPGWYYISRQQKSWSDSRQFCRDQGGDLVIINTEDEQRYVTSIIKDRTWIGLSDIEEEGYMKWVDNTPLNKGFWYQYEPNDGGGNEDCVEILPSINVIQNWNDIQCSKNKKWICEF